MKNWTGSPKVSKEERFKRENPFYVPTVSPGPAGYNLQDTKALSNSNSRTGLDKAVKNKGFNGFGNTYDKYKNVYYAELSRDFQNREGPGPCYYDGGVKPKRNDKQYSFPKGDRKLSNSPKKDNAPSPLSYRYEEGEKKARAVNSTVKFGTSKRDFDFSKCKY